MKTFIASSKFAVLAVALNSGVSASKLNQAGNEAAYHGADVFVNSGDGLAAAAQGLVAAAQGQHAEIQTLRDEMKKAFENQAHKDLEEKRKMKEAEADFEKELKELEEARSKGEAKVMSQALASAVKSFHTTDDEANLNVAKKKIDYEQGIRKNTELSLLAAKAAADKKLEKEKDEAASRLQADRLDAEKSQLKTKLDAQMQEKQIDAKMAGDAAKVKAESDIRAERLNEDVRTREEKAQQEEKRKTTLASIQEVMGTLARWSASFTRIQLYLVLFFIISVFAGFFLSKELAVLTRDQLNKWLGLPSLVRVTSRTSMVDAYVNMFKQWLQRYVPPLLLPPHWRKSSLLDAMRSTVILPDHVTASLERLATATKSAKENQVPLRHLMFYGPPGTGKTMMAKRFAEFSGLEYAIMSGGDVAPLGEQAVTELHKLFAWAQTSERGLVLFIDEADAFLCSRTKSSMSENLRNALNTLLYHTGSPSSQFMLILATNRPGDLDAAVLDRLDDKLEFALPELAQRAKLVELYYNECITKFANRKAASYGATKAGYYNSGPEQYGGGIDADCLYQVAAQLQGFSGREIAKLMGALQVYVASGEAITSKVLFDVVDRKVAEHMRSSEFSEGIGLAGC